MEAPLKTTCLHDRHVALGAQMTPFGGFDMPMQYTGIVEEHNAVRHRCGMFDVSHMGEILVTGPQAEEYVGHVFTNDVRGIPDGKILYGMMLYPDGGTVDDLLVYKCSDSEWLLVVNASNIGKDFEWARKNAEGFDVEVTDVSDAFGEIALQGPEAEKKVLEVLGVDLKDLVFYTFVSIPAPTAAGGVEAQPAEVAAEGADAAGRGKSPVCGAAASGEMMIVSRTGYTGEDGFEFYGSPAVIRRLWDKLAASGVTPCGLGCRDTLRFEVGLPLYGHELSAEISPIEAGLGMFVKMDKPEFIGRDAVLRQKTEGVRRKIVGIELKDKAVPRAGYPVEAGGVQVGEVTTGYQSISTGRSVCMAMVDIAHAALGTEVSVRIRRRTFDGTVCRKRFYDKNYKK